MLSASLHIPKKTIYGPCDEARAISKILSAAHGIEVPMPIHFGSKCLGWAVYDRKSKGVYYTPKQECAFTNYNDIQNAIAAGKWMRVPFSKTNSTALAAQNWYDFWPVGTIPEAGTYAGSAYTAQNYDKTSPGAFKIGGNVSSANKHLMSMTINTSTSQMPFILYDRVLTYESCSFNANASQNMTNTNTAGRYNGTGLSGMQIMMTCQTVFGATASNLTALAYTDQSGNSQNMPTDYTSSIFVSAAAPTTTLGARVVCPAITTGTPHASFLPLTTQNSGVRSITAFTTSAANTGTIAFVLARPIAWIFASQTIVPIQIDQVINYTCFERIYDGACLSLAGLVVTGSSPIMYGSIDIIWN
jgi:hypothetical protein